MKRSTDPRHQARILVLQELFSKYFKKGDIQTVHISIKELLELNEMTDYDKDLYKKILDGVVEKQEEIDTIIQKYAPQWSIDQMKLVDLQILRMAIYEGFVGTITPPKVAIDEAIEVAKDFGGEINSKFVNGVLGAIYEQQKEDNYNKDEEKNEG
ncbi:MAG: transcription antitermination factor NusB [Candidatus Dojkabacteria bacterium]